MKLRQQLYASLQSPRLEALQSRLVLPTARSLYLAATLICAAVIGIALAVALLFQLLSFQGASTQPVPPIPTPAPPQVAYEQIGQGFTGPIALHFVATQSAPLPVSPEGNAGNFDEYGPIGYFDAEAANGLASYPDDFDIIGGPDADRFQEVRDPHSGRTGIRLSPETAADSITQLAASKAFHIRIFARDALGNASAATNVTIALSPQSKPRPQATPQTRINEIGGPAALQAVAKKLAGIAASPGTPEYFDAYRYALAEPSRCGVDDSNEGFARAYGVAVSRFEKRLKSGNLGVLYNGLCRAWAAAQSRASESVRDAQAQREQVQSDNAAAEAKAAIARTVSKGVRDAALVVAFFAVVAFMVIALFLAFLAIEGHSKAVRMAVELLIEERRKAND